MLLTLRHWVAIDRKLCSTSWFYTIKPEYLDLGRRHRYSFILFVAVLERTGWLGVKEINGVPADETESGWPSAHWQSAQQSADKRVAISYVAGYALEANGRALLAS